MLLKISSVFCNSEITKHLLMISNDILNYLASNELHVRLHRLGCHGVCPKDQTFIFCKSKEIKGIQYNFCIHRKFVY